MERAEQKPTRHSTDKSDCGEQLCVAGVDDYQAVLDIDTEVYHGLDYLPATFPKLVAGPGVRAYLYKLGDRVVGFNSTLLVDGGQTLVTSAGRMAADCRGGGMYGRFKRRVMREFNELRDLRYYAMTVDNVNIAVRGESLLKTFRKTSEKTLTVVELDKNTAKFRTSQQSSDIQRVRQLTRDEVRDMMSRHPSQLLHLFPEGRFIMEWKPYHVMAANSDLIADGGNNRAFVATFADPARKESDGGSHPAYLLSCGSYYVCKNGLNYDVDIFGAGSDEELRAQIEWHFRRALSVTRPEDKTTIVKMFFTRKLNDVLETMRETICVRPGGYPYEKVYSVEAEFVP